MTVTASPAIVRGFVVNGASRRHAMTTRDELLEALDHHSATRQRLSHQPGTHGLRATIIIKIDEILDQLHDLDERQPVG